MKLNGWWALTVILLTWLMCYIGLVRLILRRFGKFGALLFVMATLGPQFFLAVTRRVLVEDKEGRFHIEKISLETKPNKRLATEEIKLRAQENRFIQEAKKINERIARVKAVSRARMERAKSSGRFTENKE